MVVHQQLPVREGYFAVSSSYDMRTSCSCMVWFAQLIVLADGFANQ